MHAINWGIQVKKGLLMRKKNKKTFSEKQNLSEQKQKKKEEKKKAGILFPRNQLQPHSVTSVSALVGSGCEEH